MKRFQLILISFVAFLGIITHAKADYPNWAFSKYIYEYGRLEKIELNDGLDLSNRNLFNNSINRELNELRNIRFDNAQMGYCSFAETTFVNCSFRGAKLYQVDAGDTGFVDCDFTDADISRSVFSGLLFENIIQTKNYKEKDLSNISIGFWSEAHPSKTDEKAGLDFTDFNLENASLPYQATGCIFTNAKIAGAQLTLSKEQLMSTHDYMKGSLVKITFKGVDFICMNFSQINLTGCRFERDGGMKVKLKDADFTNAVISDCDFSAVEDLALNQIKSTWNYKVGRMEGIKLPNEIQDILDAEKEQTPEHD